MNGNTAYAINMATINAKHIGPTYTSDEIDAMVKELQDEIDSIPDGNDEKY